MNPSIIKILALVILSFIVTSTHSQGCSDAGFCTINSFKPNDNLTALENKNQIRVGASFGSADKSISTIGNYFEYNRQISNSFGIDLKITSLYQAGNDISIFGISDAYLTGNYKSSDRLKLILGAKIPLTDGNNKKYNKALPMDYQSSLGTYDLIVGMGFDVKKVQWILAYQQPLTQNKNEFVSEDYPLYLKLSEFQTTNKFKRSGDVLIRVSYPVVLGEKFKVTPSLLPIYHLTKDKYTNSLGIESEIDGSKGLTLNGNAYLDYEINSRNALQLNVGIPVIVRDVRPDGLTRSFIVNLEYNIQF